MRKILNYYKNNDFDFLNLFLSLSAIIFFRTFLEKILEPGHKFRVSHSFYGNVIDYMHIYFSWICIFFTITLIISILINICYKKAFQFVVLFSLLINVVPVIDFFFNTGRIRISYSFNPESSLHYLYTLFNPFVRSDLIPFGVRVEIFLAIIGVFIVAKYFFKLNYFRSILSGISLYFIIIFYGLLPHIYNFLGIGFDKLEKTASTSYFLQQKYFFIYVVPAIGLFFLVLIKVSLEDRDNWKIFADYSYFSRLFIYLILLNFGAFFIAYEINLSDKILNFYDLLKIVTANLSIYFWFVFSKILNDICDVEIDKISNRDRSLVKERISLSKAKSLLIVSLILSFIFAIGVNESFAIYWIFLVSLSFLYSAKPLRLRRFYPLSNMLLAGINTLVFLTGSSIIKEYNPHRYINNGYIYFFVFLLVFLISHFKDFKDIESDKRFEIINPIHIVKNKKVFAIIIFTVSLSMLYLFNMYYLNISYFIYGFLLYSVMGFYLIIKSKNIKNIERVILYTDYFLLYSFFLFLLKIY